MNQLPLWGAAGPAVRPSIRPISKSKVAAGLQCHKRLYFECYDIGLREPLDAARLALFDAGRQVGAEARSRYPGGTLLDGSLQHDEAARATREAMLNPDTPAVYEAAFTFDDIRVRVDILARSGRDSWDLIEVKSSKHVKEEHYPDVAIQLHVVEGSGVSVREVCVLHLNGDYVWEGGPYDHDLLFALQHLTGEVRQRLPGLLGRVGAMRSVLWGMNPPDIAVGQHCKRPYRCPFYPVCHVDQPEHPIGTLPRMTPTLRKALEARGVRDIRAIPGDFDGLSHLQRRVRDCLISGVPFVDPELERQLSSLAYPVHFLDFESCSLALPVIPGTRPFEQTPFQWSDHVLWPDGRSEHREYLHDSRTDPRRAFALALLTSLDGAGAIVVYSGFEARIIRVLADAHPDLAGPLLEHMGRFVDLLVLIHKHYYHPMLKGSFSIKDVLPVVVSGLDYKDLDIADGSQAALAFSEITDPALPAEKRSQRRDQLLAYCRRDTEAMMALFQALRKSA